MTGSMFSVADQLVLVSGGSRGIGHALARGFAAADARVILTGRDESTLPEAAKTASAGRHPVEWRVCDVSQPDSIAAVVVEITEVLGPIDTLVNVAGVNVRRAAAEISVEQFDFVVDINLRGAFFLAQAVGRTMLARGRGSILNIDSLNSDAPLKNVAPYAMSKSGMKAMTRALALEWGPGGVRVNGLAPGFILTDLTKQLWSDPTMQQWGKENTPLGRIGTPDDLVGTALFLASPAAAFLTGQTIYVDGGFSAGRAWPIPQDGGQGHTRG